jgi:glyoxylase-like metal-dependent hydrolase (beta-lactamase superfamily II)
VGSLIRIDLDQPIPGYREFITCWLYHDERIAYVVDPGPTSSISVVVDAIARAGIDRLDAVLLTHIHIDHAGGVGDLVRRVPVGRVVCHPRGARHLVDPTRLWEGSLATLGDLVEVYGPIAPVEEALLATSSRDVPGLEVDTIHTPGHAPHHVCYAHGERLYLGEVAGTRFATTAGPTIRPATPHRFEYEVADASIARLAAITPLPSEIVYGHYGTAAGTAATFDAARWQLAHWLVTIADQGLTEQPRGEAMDAWMADMAVSDPHFAPALAMASDLIEREHTFTGNSIGGMIRYLAGGPDLTAARERAGRGPGAPLRT